MVLHFYLLPVLYLKQEVFIISLAEIILTLHLNNIERSTALAGAEMHIGQYDSLLLSRIQAKYK